MPIDLISNIQPAPGGAGLFPTHLDIYGAGGYQVQPTTTARDAIPALNRKQGMVVYVVADSTEYRLDAGLTTWTPVVSGGGTLAGDVTGPSSANTVVNLTGAAGVVTVPTAALAFGATPATATGFIRIPHTSVFLVGRNQANSANVNLLTWTSPGNSLVLGNSTTDSTQVLSGTDFVVLVGSARVDFLASGNRSTVKYYYSEAATARFDQDSRSTNTAPGDFTIATQPPFNNVATTGANNKPGDLIFDVGTATNASILRSAVRFNSQGANRATLVYDQNGNVRWWGGVGGLAADPYLQITPSGGVAIVAGTSQSATVAAGTGSTIYFSIPVGTPKAQLAATGWTWDVPAAAFDSFQTAPVIQQNVMTTDSLPQALTIRSQQPFSGATGVPNGTPGDVVLDMGTPAASSTFYGDISFTAGGAERGGFRYLGSGSIAYYAGTIAGGTSPRMLGTLNGAWQFNTPADFTVNCASGLFFQVNSSTRLQVSSNTVLNGGQYYSWGETSTTNPTILHNPRSTDALPGDMRIIPQGPAAAATGANRTPGSLILDMGTPTNAGTTYGEVRFAAGGATVGTVKTTGSGIILIGGTVAGTDSYLQLAPTSSGTFNLVGNAGNNNITAAGVGAVLNINVAGALPLKFVSAQVQFGQPVQLLTTSLIFGATQVTPIFRHSNHTSDLVTTNMVVRAQDAYASATGVNRDGAFLDIQGGTRTDTNGRRKGVRISLSSAASGTFFEITDVQAEAVSPSRVVSLALGAAVTTSNMPTGTGDRVIVLGYAATIPSVNPTGCSVLYVDPADGGTKIRGPSGTVTVIAPA